MSSHPFTVYNIRYEHSPAALIASKKIPKLTVAGEEIGPYVENTQFKVRMWVAEALIKLGLARLQPEREPINLAELHKIHLKETMQTSRRLSGLPENFYPRLKRFIKVLREESYANPAKAAELQKAVQLSIDILTCRLNKILLFTSLNSKSDTIFQNLTPEERALYERLRGEVEKWQSAVWPLQEDE
ncbi:MAG: hypothetical protein QXJ75_00430 [Candidatus Bathyarchaeia archaeon]